MGYWGKVKPGTPAVRELEELMITKASVGPMDNNAYLLRCRRTDDQVLIDAAAEPDTLLQLVGSGGGVRSQVCCRRGVVAWRMFTHGLPPHAGSGCGRCGHAAGRRYRPLDGHPTGAEYDQGALTRRSTTHTPAHTTR